MKIQTVQTISGDRRPWRSLTRPWRPWGRAPSRWPCSRWGHSLSLKICLLISLVRTCLTTWDLMQCSPTIGSQSITPERSSSTPWPRQTGERRPLIGWFGCVTASDWSGDWSGDKTSSSGWRTTLRITKWLTWCDMRTRGSTWREQDPLCLTIKVKTTNLISAFKQIFHLQVKSPTHVNLSGPTQRSLKTCANKLALSLCYSGLMTSKVQNKFHLDAIIMMTQYHRSAHLPHQRVHVHHDQPGRDLYGGDTGWRG